MLHELEPVRRQPHDRMTGNVVDSTSIPDHRNVILSGLLYVHSLLTDARQAYAVMMNAAQ